MSDIRITIHALDGERDDALVCNWCGELHALESSYIETFLEKAKKNLTLETDPVAKLVLPEECWTCGRCILALHGIQGCIFKVDCHEHEVPETRVFKFKHEEKCD